MADEHHQIKWVKRGSMSIHLGTLLNQKYQNIRASQVFNTYNTHTHTHTWLHDNHHSANE